jgi:hypothetical protein
MSKVFIIGFNKTGTRTLHNYFDKNGVPSLHWEYGRLAKRIKYNFENNKPLLEGYSKYKVYGDMEDHFNFNYAHITYFKELDKQYPNSKFILNIRNIDTWIKSRNLHMNGKYREYFCYKLKITTKELNDIWRTHYYEHYNNVIEYFKDTNKLLIFDIEKDKVDKLNNFLDEYQLNDKLYTHEGKTNI